MYCPNGHGKNQIASTICNICSEPMTVSHSTPGPFIKAICAEEGCDLKSRRYFQGRIYSDTEKDDFGNRKVVIRGSAVEGDWDLFAASPDMLDALSFAEQFLTALSARDLDAELAGNETNDAAREVLFQIQAAIAKAEGKK